MLYISLFVGCLLLQSSTTTTPDLSKYNILCLSFVMTGNVGILS